MIENRCAVAALFGGLRWTGIDLVNVGAIPAVLAFGGAINDRGAIAAALDVR